MLNNHYHVLFYFLTSSALLNDSVTFRFCVPWFEVDVILVTKKRREIDISVSASPRTEYPALVKLLEGGEEECCLTIHDVMICC